MKKARMLPAAPVDDEFDDSKESLEVQHGAVHDNDDEEFDPDTFYGGPSKSQLKREAEALQKLGTKLVELSVEQLKKIDIPDNLRTALRDAQKITANGAKRRQAQLIGKLMRSVDTAPIQEALDKIAGVSASAKAHQQKLEKLRDQIMANDSVFATLARDYPQADIQQLRQLRRNALKEAEQSKPPRAYRELFRQLRELVEGQQASAEQDAEVDPELGTESGASDDS